MASLRDVANAAGVSTSVASRVLTADRSARISPQTRARVRAAADAVNYVPDHRARALRSRRSGALALIVPDVTNSVFGELHAGVQEAARGATMAVLLSQMPASTTEHPTLASIVGQGRVDGVVLQRREEHDDRMLAQAINVELPVVLFNSTLRSHAGSVTLDDAVAARVATEHLVALGHTRIGLLGGRREHDAARRRAVGFRAAMHDAGLRIDRDWLVDAGWEAPAGESGLARLLAARRRPTGIVVASVNAAFGAAHHAAGRGIGVPAQLSLVSIQDTWMARVFQPPLTVVRMPLREAGETAARMLLDYLDGGELSDVVLTRPAATLIVRESTGPPGRPAGGAIA
jgi:LacI family transcriptional regulator